MAVHRSARLAGHDDGWNGRIYERPDGNTYCVGMHAYPGDVVAGEQDLDKEMALAGKPLAKLAGADLPPCIYSVNAFGPEPIPDYSNPPDFFRGGAPRTQNGISPKPRSVSGPMRPCTAMTSTTKPAGSIMTGASRTLTHSLPRSRPIRA